MKYPVHNFKGEKLKEIDLPESVFGVKKNDALVHQVYVSQYANQRQVIAHTKDRAERAGSGKKPWKQKGTGRARVGSVRTPIWRKGGIVFGPTKDRNFKKDIPKKMGQIALHAALSGKVREKKLVVVESLKMAEVETKLMSKALADLKIKGKALIGYSKDENIMKRAGRNLDKVKTIDSHNLNVFDLLNSNFLILSEESVKLLASKDKK